MTFLFLAALLVSGCSHSHLIEKNDTPKTKQNMKILNNSCSSGTSKIHLKNGDIIYAESVSMSNDTVKFASIESMTIKTLLRGEVKKIVTRDGPVSFLQGLGFGIAASIGGMFIGSAAGGGIHDASGPPNYIAIPFIGGFVLGVAAGELIGAEETFVFPEE